MVATAEEAQTEAMAEEIKLIEKWWWERLLLLVNVRERVREKTAYLKG